MYAEGLLANDADQFQQELPVNDSEGSQHNQGERCVACSVGSVGECGIEASIDFSLLLYYNVLQKEGFL